MSVRCGEESFSKRQEITGLDVNIKSLKKCHCTSRILGDACSLPFKNQSFNAAVEMGCLPYCSDWRKGMKEMVRVSKRVYLV